MKLSFARAEGRDYRQLPARERLRERPLPADIVCYISSTAFFGTGVLAQRLLAFDVREVSTVRGDRRDRCGT